MPQLGWTLKNFMLVIESSYMHLYIKYESIPVNVQIWKYVETESRLVVT